MARLEYMQKQERNGREGLERKVYPKEMTIRRTIDPNNTIVEPIIPEEELPEDLVCNICYKRADKKVTHYGNPDGILRLTRYCDDCIMNELPQFRQAVIDQSGQFDQSVSSE